MSGSLAACGRIEELGKQIVSEGHFVLEVEAEPCDDRFLGFIHGLEGVNSIEKEGSKFIVQSRRDLRKDITGFLGTHGYTLLHLRQKGGDLDEIYRCYFEKAEQEERQNGTKKISKRFAARR